MRLVALASALVLTACLEKTKVAEVATTATAMDTAATAATAPKRALAAALNPVGWVAVTEPTDAILQNLTIPADAPTRGMWSAAATWPLNGLHQAVLPDGKVLTWGNEESGPRTGRVFDVWDPSRGLFDAGSHSTSYDINRQDSFCAPAIYLNDGRLMITGGNGASETSSQYFTPSNAAISQGPRVADARWYAVMVTLADGRTVILGGINTGSEYQWQDPNLALARGESSLTPEIYENGAWRALFGAQSRDAFGPDNLRASLPKVWTAPDGRVFGIGSDQMYYLDPNANGGNGGITIVGPYKPAPTGTNVTNDTALNVGPSMSAVMFAPGRVLAVGGNAFANGNGYPASRMATVIDINGGGAVKTEQPSMAFPRNYANTVVLPNGQVLVTGGETRATNDINAGIYAAEIWNPATGTWSTMASASRYRAYHSQTSLLTNGTVLSSGGGLPGPVQLSGEIFYPPYLFRTVGTGAQLAPRPRLVGISGLKHSHGAQMQFDLSNSGVISQVALIGLSVGTHSFNAGQRRIPLAYTQDNFRITATVPGANLVPPGYYQLVAVDANGVPSRGTIVAIGANVAQPPATTAAYAPPDTGAPVSVTSPPANAVACAPHNGTCVLPAGRTGTVWYGVDTRWVSRTGVTGSIGCNDVVFGDPAPGLSKTCSYLLDGAEPTPPPPPPTNQAPTVALTAPANNASIAQGTPITLTATAADRDGTVARVEFYDGATLLGTDTTAPFGFDWVNAAPGPHTVTARAFDNAGASTTSAALSLTITTTAPLPGQPPATATACAPHNGTCVLPAGRTGTVWYGVDTRWVSRTGVTGSIGCNDAVFGDPAPGVPKTCSYLLDGGTPPPPTNQAPTVALTAPANNASIAQGTAITLAATAADRDGTVARVEFYDGATLLGTDTTAPFGFNWVNAAVGPHTVTARAFDNTGASTTSAPLTLTITTTALPPGQPPATATACAPHNGICVLPAGRTGTVWYGVGTRWVSRTGLSGSIGCNDAVFGDPAPGVPKTCSYLLDGGAPPPPPPTNQAPTVALTAPANNASIAQGTAITLAATAADRDGTVARVEFYDGATLLGTDTTAPFGFNWVNAAAGPHTVTARAFDNAGASTTSTALSLTVTPAPTPAGQPPATAVACALQNAICTVPAGATATVWYGAGTRWAVRTGVTGSIGCNNGVFGDPAPGFVKACRYQVTTTSTPTLPPPLPPTLPPTTAVTCAIEGATCTVPAGRTATVWYGAGTAWRARAGVTGSIACTNVVFGDPAPGIVKTCRYQ